MYGSLYHNKIVFNSKILFTHTFVCLITDVRFNTSANDDVSFYNSTTSTWTLANPRTTWESQSNPPDNHLRSSYARTNEVFSILEHHLSGLLDPTSIFLYFEVHNICTYIRVLLSFNPSTAVSLSEQNFKFLLSAYWILWSLEHICTLSRDGPSDS